MHIHIFAYIYIYIYIHTPIYTHKYAKSNLEDSRTGLNLMTSVRFT